MSVFNATVFALQYGLPLLSYARVALQVVNENATNTFLHNTQLSTAASTTVVLPNVDTLYSSAAYDLSENNVQITVPSIEPDRYWSVAFYDPFGNNYATPGSVNNNTGGTYLLSYVPNAAWGFHPYTPESGSNPYKGLINSPTIDGTILARILVKNNSSDLAYVQSLTNATTMKPVPRLTGTSSNCTNTNNTLLANTPIITNSTMFTNDTLIANITTCDNNTNAFSTPSLTKANLAPYTSTNNTALATLQLLANFFNSNPPFDISAASVESLLSNLMTAGVYDHAYREPPGLNLTEAYETAISNISASYSDYFEPLNNNWLHNVQAGSFGDQYLDRALTGMTAYLEQTPDQALYPMLQNRALLLNNGEAYTFTFSGKPPVASDGFWSLTLYNSQGYLVENSLNKYSVGDRSNITYPDGTQAYGSSATRKDGKFQVLIQAENMPPPRNWTNNWLPSPANGTFSVALRFFAPKNASTDGSYQYPVISKGRAIVS
ncbi:DUF1254-domain-containing protein [Mollisia scopiformis]|uniref:DUF1254-domain-containing protein n=1 Tax=Mollisia scopiformis TaxID=149040 RepID=A0A194WT26_MOLSC|nr:DUF1254-domain-containing protein [Mollisia scopiformis]KUJ10772.1 DUF1254-domain-containing protein [Mollisia scopiformis]